MSVQIRLESGTRVVRCSPQGDVSFDEMANASLRISQKYGHVRPLRILVDVRFVQVHMSADDNKRFAQFVAQLPGYGSAKIVVLHPLSHNPMSATDRVSREGGLSICQCVSEGEAYAWLAAESSTLNASH
uniref:hypothetical protein n=1 Tax=Microbulbifer agarilyticus TaxID=260552 RepID=UPI0002558E00|nr:hypothetical protein [Microbulbifer agarilyticus]